MGATRNLGYIENLISYDANDNIGVGGAVNVLYKVTLGGNTLASGTLSIGTVTNANTDTDKFLVQDANGVIRFRTGAEVASDIGASVGFVSTVKHLVKLGENISKGQAVYISSADGTNMIVSKASNDSEAASSKVLGILETGGVTNDQVYVITEGLLPGLNTSTATAGDEVWLATAGNLIFGNTNKPYAPANLVFLGVVTRAQQNNGEIFVKVQNGSELEELHNVQITTTPSDNSVLSYENSSSLYKMKSIPTLLGYTPVTDARTITINGTSYDLTANRTWSVGTVTSVAALTIDTTGTDVTSTVATGTTTPVITLSIPTASATNRGALSSTDWSTFNGKQAALNGTGFVKVTGTTVSYDNSTYLTTGTAGTTYVPYTGGTANVNLGVYDLDAGNININGAGSGGGALRLKQFGSSEANLEGYNSISTLTSGVFYFTSSASVPNFKNFALNPSGLTDNTLRTYALPDASGTLALTSNLSSYLPLTGGTLTGALSGTSATFSSSVTASSLIKSGGTSSQILVADGSVLTAGTNITISGGTISSTGGGISTINTLTATTQTFATGTSGTDFNISSSTSTHTFNIPTASASNRGALSSADWTTFNNKQSALTLGNVSSGNTAHLTVSGGTGAIIGSGLTLTVLPGAIVNSGLGLTTTGNSGAATFSSATLNIPNYTLAGLGGLSNDSDSEQTIGGRIHYWNVGGNRMNTDPRWNESGYDADLGALHIWATTAGGANYGRAGIALYNGSAYQYLTTKASTTGMFVNNTQIVTNSGTWSINVTGSAGSVAWSNVSSKPSNIMYYQSFTLDANTMDSNSTGFTYSVNAPFTGPIARFSTGGGYDMWLGGNYGGSGNVFYIRTRNGDAASMNPWRLLITDGNIASQKVDGALKLWATSHPNDYYIVHNWTGSYWQLTSNHGAGVQVAYANESGNATTAGGLAVHTSTNNEANKIVRTDANGYIQAGWINSISGNMGFENRIARITCSTDQYMRFQTLTEFKVSLGMSGKNDYSRRIDYTSDANYHVGSFGHGGTDIGNPDRIFHYGSGFFDIWSGAGTYPSGTSHIHGFNVLHYTVGYGGNAYGWQMASQYNQTGLIYARWCSAGNFSAWQTIITSVNIGSQSVNYANSAGTATTATTANNLAANTSPTIQVLNFTGVGGNSGNANQSYAIYQEGGAWSPPFPDLCIGYHTGIKIGAYFGYNGTRFYNNSDFATLTFSVNDGDNNTRGYYDIIAYASDRRLKHNVKPIENALFKVTSLVGMTYEWNSVGDKYGWTPSKEREAGVFAQDVQAVLPEAVKLAPFDQGHDEHGNMFSKSGENFLTVKYEKIVPLLIEAIKEQQKQIEELKSQIKNK